MPPYEAMDAVLPEYQYIFVDPNNPNEPRKVASPRTRQPPANTSMPGAYGTSIRDGSVNNLFEKEIYLCAWSVSGTTFNRYASRQKIRKPNNLNIR